DFTFIDDIAKGVVKVLEKPPVNRDLYKIYNIGNNKSVKLTDFIDQIEIILQKQAAKEMLPMQPGDVSNTWANVDDLIKDFNYQPNTTIEEGVNEFVKWYKTYYKIQ